MKIKTAEQEEIQDTVIKLLELSKEDEDILIKYISEQGIEKLLNNYHSIPVSLSAKEKIKALNCILAYEEVNRWKR